MNTSRTVTPISGEGLDFGGHLRYLRFEGLPSLKALQLSSLVGLKELYVDQETGLSTDQTMKLLSAVAPTLEKLTIDCEDVTGVVASLSLLARLTRLSLLSIPASVTSLPLPPSLVSLQFANDDNLLPILDHWNAEPALFPATLQHINIRFVNNFRTLERLPPIAKLGTAYYHNPIELYFRRFAPGTLRFRTLEVYFENRHSDKIVMVKAECARLGVAFSRRLEKWKF